MSTHILHISDISEDYVKTTNILYKLRNAFLFFKNWIGILGIVLATIILLPIILLILAPIAYLYLRRTANRIKKYCETEKIEINNKNYGDIYNNYKGLIEANELFMPLARMLRNSKSILSYLFKPFIVQLRRIYVESKRFQYRLSKQLFYTRQDLGLTIKEDLNLKEFSNQNKDGWDDDKYWEDFELKYNKYAV